MTQQVAQTDVLIEGKVDEAHEGGVELEEGGADGEVHVGGRGLAPLIGFLI